MTAAFDIAPVRTAADLAATAELFAGYAAALPDPAGDGVRGAETGDLGVPTCGGALRPAQAAGLPMILMAGRTVSYQRAGSQVEQRYRSTSMK